MKILLCFGTRPEAIKMAPLYQELRRCNFEVEVCVTGQHREMLDQVLDFFEIQPKYDLQLMKQRQSLNQLSARILSEADNVLNDFQPYVVLVHGDTTTSTMMAMAAFHKGIKVAHVEAGLRTHNKQSPFPEELNRQLTARIADYHFVPTIRAENNLKNENIISNNIIVTGNTVVDALQLGLQKIENGFVSEDLISVKRYWDTSKKLVLVTGHRRESFGEGFEKICKAIATIAKEENVQIIYPVHLNPNVQEPVHRILGILKNVILLPPVDYPAFIFLMQQSYLIITDSGGIQEEAPSLGKPVLVTRTTTERPEAIESGTVILVGKEEEKIVSVCKELLNNQELYSEKSKKHNPYGDGNASRRIVNFIKQLNF